jgi:hypothetical protein
MYLTKYIERMGTGIRDMMQRCRNAGLPEPQIRIDGGFFVLTIPREKPVTGPKSASRNFLLNWGLKTGSICGTATLTLPWQTDWWSVPSRINPPVASKSTGLRRKGERYWID